MNDFQIYNKPYSKLSLNKNGFSKVKSKNFPQDLKNILITNTNCLEISSLYGNFYHNSKKNTLDENYNINHINYNNINNNKNISLPLNSVNVSSIKPNTNYKFKEISFNNQKNNLFKKKHETYVNKPKKEESSNLNIVKTVNGIMINKGNKKINIIPKKTNFKYMNVKDNISLNLNKNIGKSLSISKSKSKDKNKRENKSYNNKIKNNMNNIIFDKYIKLYKVGGKEIIKKAKTKNLNLNFLNKDYTSYNLNKFSNEANNTDINKISSLNIQTNNKLLDLKKKNKSSNLLITNLNKYKIKDIQNPKLKQNIVISKNLTNNNSIKNIEITKNNRSENNYNEYNNDISENNKKYLTVNHIMYLIDKKKAENKKGNMKYKQLSLNDLKNSINFNINNNFNNIYLEKKQNEENNKKIIFDYKMNNISLKNIQNNNFINNVNNINYQNYKSYNIYKSLNERLNTKYNDNNNSLEINDKLNKKIYKEESNKKSNSSNRHDSFEYLYPEIYIKDDDLKKSKWNNNKEKELDETESPLKMDTDKNSNENSGVLSYEQVKDIICYYNMSNTDKKSNFLFQVNERQIFDLNNRNIYEKFFFGNNENENNDKKKGFIYDYKFFNV